MVLHIQATQHHLVTNHTKIYYPLLLHHHLFLRISKKYEITDVANKPKEADEWYKQALERARNIAKNLGQSSNTSSLPHQDAPITKLTDNATPQTIYNKQ